jgi:hypothetical protein
VVECSVVVVWSWHELGKVMQWRGSCKGVTRGDVRFDWQYSVKVDTLCMLLCRRQSSTTV